MSLPVWSPRQAAAIERLRSEHTPEVRKRLTEGIVKMAHSQRAFALAAAGAARQLHLLGVALRVDGRLVEPAPVLHKGRKPTARRKKNRK